MTHPRAGLTGNTKGRHWAWTGQLANEFLETINGAGYLLTLIADPSDPE